MRGRRGNNGQLLTFHGLQTNPSNPLILVQVINLIRYNILRSTQYLPFKLNIVNLLDLIIQQGHAMNFMLDWQFLVHDGFGARPSLGIRIVMLYED